MEIKIGDTVRFLNEVGGGVVTGVFGPEQVIVEQGDGFGFPYLRSECVVVSAEEKTEGGQGGGVVSSLTPKCDPKQLKLYLGFAASEKALIDFCGELKLYLINDSSYSLQMNILTRVESEKNYILYLSAQVLPFERMLLDELEWEELSRIEHLHIQITALKEREAFEVHAPIDRKIDLKLAKFYKPTSFVDSEALGCKAITIELT